MSELITTQDQVDFRQARAKAFTRSVVGLIRGQQRKLMAWDDVRDKLNLRGLVYRGVQIVQVSQIMGSVGRFRDFDDAFLPKKNESRDRWAKINRAFYSDVSLPPVKLYKVGDVYFVLDGNHRVSVAKEHGVTFIDAEVSEAVMRVPVTEHDLNADSLELLGEYQEFLERSRLDILRPDQNIRFTIGGAYPRLIEHIAVHRYYMGLEQKRDIGEDEAVADWYGNVYQPIVRAVREQDVLSAFSGRTEADLYLWVIDHKHFLDEATEETNDVTPEQAAADYAERFAPKSTIERVTDAVTNLLGAIKGGDERKDAAGDEAAPTETEGAAERAAQVWQATQT